jgi:predicted nucleic acid-binding protein
MIVIDASVWVAYLLPQDTWHAASVQFLDPILDAGTALVVPTILLVEVSASVARQTQPIYGMRARTLAIDLFRWIAVDDALVQAAAQFGAELRIKGTDSIYATIAAQLGLALVSWDRDHLERASARVQVYSPATAPPARRMG